ncbi:DUF3386 domain-containing protein [filamentous cyanobacterium LEGE 11480]|uniref:DUF3386 domain-containing protein n=1 Tax=Romeriopsis navalis LEGE 11480 TaxID=2777977 RepID=A0A928VNE9_9CYAN|nr:DUF3386 domain-containing protein [Romeriopsis navalis]MBE9030822.1 DUF3386 domain-containing protein [Romeriopsis navalis LEGE 11480]
MNIAVGTDATTLFKAAYDNRYTWDHDFPGYTADVTYRCEGTEFHGKAKVSPDPRMGFKGEVTEITDEAVLKAVQGQLWEIAVHRVRRPFEKTHADNQFSFGKTDESGAVEILIDGKVDHYKVRDQEIVLVHRTIHGSIVTINTFSFHDTGEGCLSHTYDSVYQDAKTGEPKGGKSEFTDTYERVGNYQILNRREIKTEEGTMEFTFSNIQLLK